VGLSAVGIGGELAAIQDSASGVALQLTNLHGDVVATASLSPEATKPTATFEFDEFGNPKGAGPGRFGWLGGKQRRTELPSGVIQMEARSYVPRWDGLSRLIQSEGLCERVRPCECGPANGYDLEGTKSTSSIWLARARRVIRPGTGYSLGIQLDDQQGTKRCESSKMARG
jgi:hypothetical protein